MCLTSYRESNHGLAYTPLLCTFGSSGLGSYFHGAQFPKAPCYNHPEVNETYVYIYIGIWGGAGYVRNMWYIRNGIVLSEVICYLLQDGCSFLVHT